MWAVNGSAMHVVRPADWTGSGRGVFLAAAVTVVGISPVFLVGAQGVDVERTLRMTVADIGIAVGVFSGATALSTAVLGRVVQRIGIRRGLVGAMAASIVAFAWIALSRAPLVLYGALVFAGAINGAAQPSANALLATNRARRPAQAFGIKQASATGASLLAGLVVPLVALTIGWRWSFVAMCVPSTGLAAISLLYVPDQRKAERAQPPKRMRDGPDVPIAVLAVAGGFGAAAGNAFAAFFVLYGVHSQHVAQSTTALIFALASLSGVIGRVMSGRAVDSAGLPATVLAGCLVMCGVAGDLLIASTPFGTIGSLVVGGVVAVGLGWAWPGLIHFDVASRDPRRAARSTGVVLSGFATGACVGPLLLGELARASGFGMLWRVVAVLNLAAGLVLLVGTRLSRRSALVSTLSEP